MILLDYFIFGVYHFMLYMGKDEEDAKYMAIIWGVIILGLGISSLWEAYIIYHGVSTDLSIIRRGGLHAYYWSCPTLIVILLLRYYLFSKKKLENLEVKYKSSSILKRRILRWMLIIGYLLIIVIPFLFERYIDNRF